MVMCHVTVYIRRLPSPRVWCAVRRQGEMRCGAVRKKLSGDGHGRELPLHVHVHVCVYMHVRIPHMHTHMCMWGIHVAHCRRLGRETANSSQMQVQAHMKMCI